MIDYIAEAFAEVWEMAKVVNVFLDFKVCFLSRLSAELIINVFQFCVQVFTRSV